MLLPPKRCPECGEEYVHAASVCVHCDVELVLDGERPPAGSAPTSERELPPVSELVCVRAASVGWALSLSEERLAVGIPHRIQAATSAEEEGSRQRPGANLPYGVYVLAEDAEAASSIDRAHTGRQIPDAPTDPGRTELRDDECPACGATVAASAEACPDCGLALLVAD